MFCSNVHVLLVFLSQVDEDVALDQAVKFCQIQLATSAQRQVKLYYSMFSVTSLSKYGFDLKGSVATVYIQDFSDLKVSFIFKKKKHKFQNFTRHIFAFLFKI